MTPQPALLALLGGALLGLSASLLLLASGRVAGVGGVFAGLLSRGQPGAPPRRLAACGVALLAGLLAGGGLGLSGLTLPATRAAELLDVRGSWDPTLLLVLIGAVAIHAPLHGLTRPRHAPPFDEEKQAK